MGAKLVDRKSEYLRRVTRGEVFMPWQEHGRRRKRASSAAGSCSETGSIRPETFCGRSRKRETLREHERLREGEAFRTARGRCDCDQALNPTAALDGRRRFRSQVA